jgi:hypothetical protein
MERAIRHGGQIHSYQSYGLKEEEIMETLHR